MPPKVQKEIRSKPTRKKTARACNHCHKAHMTCDDTRPCKRCVARGLESTCVDAPRKKKKYLMDVPDGLHIPPVTKTEHNLLETNSISSSTNSKITQTPVLSDLYSPSLSQPLSQPLSQHSSSTTSTHHHIPTTYELNSSSHYTVQSENIKPEVYSQSHNNNHGHNHNHSHNHNQNHNHNHNQNHNFNQHDSLNHNQQSTRRQSRSKFMSSAANNEYSILSHIINQDDFNAINMGLSPSHSQSDSTMSPQSFETNNGNHNTISRLRQSSTHSHNSRNSSPTPLSSTTHDIYNSFKQGDKSVNQYMLGFIQDQLVTYPEVMKSIQGDRTINQKSSTTNESDENISLSFSIAINESAANSPNYPNGTSDKEWGLRFKEPEDIYAKINKPFSYTPGFHSLIHYLRSRFNRKDLLQMAKSMASYRPSFIACTNTLKEEDLIFMEQCFQRTLLEYDKFISISGTPTIVWRRTGQIAYVSEEFSILTGWSKDQLLNKVTFIVELMDDSSVIEYFDLFSTIAYGDFKAATMGGCTLLTPDHSTIRTTCIWTLKRDVFGIPMMIIGNFLPII